jgi:hypothetical protein
VGTKPHRKLIIGAWPAGLRPHGLLPPLAAGDQALASLPSAPRPDEPLQLPSGVQAEATHLLALRSRIRFVEQDMFDADLSAPTWCSSTAPALRP